jgi:hypothetical protein
MEHVAHSDWMFDHSLGHHAHTAADPQAATSSGASQTTQQPTQANSAASVATTLWHHTDSSAGSSSAQGSSGSSVSSNASSSTASPTITISNNVLNNGLTVNAGGSVSLPVSVSPGNGHTSVTIAGLTNYETVTDSVDGKTFTPDANGSITLSAAEVNSGLSLASNYTGTDHPANTLAITATDTFAHHTLTSAPQTITVTDPPASTSGSGSSASSGTNTLTLQVSGDQYKGDPQIEVFVDGHQIGGNYKVTADHASGQTQTITITGNFDPTVAHQVQVEFVNDAWDGTSWWSNGGSADGHDRNVYVESISLNGQTLEGSQGTDAASNGVVQASNSTEAAMDGNGTLTFNVPADPPATTNPAATGTATTSSSGSGSSTTGANSGSGSNTLTLQVSGDQYNGDPQIEVFVDGQQTGSTYTVTADHASGQTQTITITGNFDPTVAHQVQVEFVNDAWDGTSWWSNGGSADGHDRNVYVESISLNGQTLNGSQGTDAASNGAVAGANPNEAVMDTNGTVTFSVPADAPATSVSTAATTGTSGSGGGSASGRDWAFFVNEGTNTANWTSVNSGWSSQPIDGMSAYTDIGDGYFTGTAQHWSPNPQAITMTVQYGTPGTNSINMAEAASGAYNSTWLSWLQADASQAAANGTPVTVVRIWQEINGDWQPWSVNETGATVDGTAPGAAWPAATIIAAWNNMAAQVHTAFPNAQIEWNLNVGGGWSGAPGNGTGFDLYPGNQYVNIIGLDAYEKSTSWANTVSGSGVNLNNLVAFATANGKEVAISETASSNNDGSYLTSMTNYFNALGKQAAYISYYDEGTANNGGDIIYSTTGTDAAPADRVALNDSSFGTEPYVGTL